MKRTLRLVGMAAMVLLLAASCKKEEKNEEGLVMKTFSAGIAQNGNAKTGLIPEGDASTSDGHYFKQMWLENDQINVNGVTFPIDKGSIQYHDNGANGTCSATFSGLIQPAEDYYAIYPVSEKAVLHLEPESKTATFEIPNVQRVVRTETSKGVMYEPDFLPMAAHCTAGSEQLDFINLCGLLELRLYCPADLNLSVNKIKLVATNGETIAGSWKYDFNTSSFSYYNPNRSQSTDIVMSFDENVTVSTNESEPTSFLFVIPPVLANKSFRLVVYGNGTESDFVSLQTISTVDKPLEISGNEVLYNKTPLLLQPVLGAGISPLQHHSEYSEIPEGTFRCLGQISHINCTDGVDVLKYGFCIVETNNGGTETTYTFPEPSNLPDLPNGYYVVEGGTESSFTHDINGLDKEKKYAVASFVVYKYHGDANEKYFIARTGDVGVQINIPN